MQVQLKQAVLWQPADGGDVRCGLCNHRCRITEDRAGRCGVRKNIGGRLYTLCYDKVCAAHIDPIEKKPLYHFLPGSRSFSVATEGCNFRCEFCQNWQISQMPVEQGQVHGDCVGPGQIVDAALRGRCKSISYTYTEPTVFMELAMDCGKLAKENGLANVFVSNGYQTREAIDMAADWLDAINVDLKAFSEDYYHDLCKARLEAVKDTISYVARHTGIWMEITTLLVPGHNDGDDEIKALADWLVREAGPDVPWHVSRFYPQYKLMGVESTPLAGLERAIEIGRAAGLRYVYLGNVPGSKAEGTFCPGCGRLLIDRLGYTIRANHLQGGCCPDCGTRIAGIWT